MATNVRSICVGVGITTRSSPRRQGDSRRTAGSTGPLCLGGVVLGGFDAVGEGAPGAAAAAGPGRVAEGLVEVFVPDLAASGRSDPVGSGVVERGVELAGGVGEVVALRGGVIEH